MKALGDECLIVKWNKNRPLDSYKRQVETRKKHYLDRSLNLPRGIGKGDTVIFKQNCEEICLRSSYEFIYALYLVLSHMSFEYESVRIEYNGKLYFSDFLVQDTIIEIKGMKSSKDADVSKVFTSAGYKFKILYEKDIEEIKIYLEKSLSSVLNLNDILNRIHLCSKNREYMEFDADKLLKELAMR